MWTRAAGPRLRQGYMNDAAIAVVGDYPGGLWSAHAVGRSLFAEDHYVKYYGTMTYSVYFHYPCDATAWLLHEFIVGNSTEGRTLVHGRIFTRDGVHVATSEQHLHIPIAAYKLQPSLSDVRCAMPIAKMDISFFLIHSSCLNIAVEGINMRWECVYSEGAGGGMIQYGGVYGP